MFYEVIIGGGGGRNLSAYLMPCIMGKRCSDITHNWHTQMVPAGSSHQNGHLQVSQRENLSLLSHLRGLLQMEAWRIVGRKQVENSHVGLLQNLGEGVHKMVHWKPQMIIQV